MDPVVGTWLHTLAYAALVVWVLRTPPEVVLEGAEGEARWRDLRLWILPLAAVQVALYWIF